MSKKLKFGGIIAVASAVLTLSVLLYLYLAAAVATVPTDTDIEAREAKQAHTEPEKPPTAKELLRLVNIERKKVGVAPLKVHENMTATAQWKAQHMSDNDYFKHNVPDTDNMLSVEMQPYTSICEIFSENITDNLVDEDNTAKQSIYNWINSKPHYKAMINPEYTLTGFGVSGTKIVQHFCIAR